MISYTEVSKIGRKSLLDLIPMQFPISMYIETTNKCNYRCSYCPLSSPDYPDIVGGWKTMTYEQFSIIAKQVKAGGHLKVLRFYLMGEPLMNKDLAKMIQLSTSLGIADRTELTTNGVLLKSEKICKDLISSGLDYIRISISSIDDDRNFEITKSKIAVNDIYEGIKQLRKLRGDSPKPFIYVKLLTPKDSAEIEKFNSMYVNEADEVVIEKPMNWNGFENRDYIEATYGKDVKFDESFLYPNTKKICPFPFYTLVVSCDGDVTSCCVDWNKATKVGNVFETDLKTLWNGEKMREFRKMHLEQKRHLNPSCKNCMEFHITPSNIDNITEEQKQQILNTSEK